MRLTKWLHRAVAPTIVAGAALVTSPLLAEQADEGPQRQTPQQQTPASAEQEYWVGIAVRSVDDTLRSQLRLGADEGLVVLNVVPNGPADGALREHDILLSVGKQKLRSPRDLVDLVQQSAGEPLEFEMLHKGEQQTVKVTPGVRPAQTAAGDFLMPRPELDRLRAWMDQLEQRGGAGPLTLRNFGPGVLIDPPAGQPLDIPGGYEISSVHKPGEPAMITVKRGNETWTVTENDIDQLPADVQPAVKQMLAGRARGLTARPRFDERFEQMEQQMQRMLEEMRRLRAGDQE